jgi:photosynthetic reaction center cytochrome c subunit
MSLMTTPLSLRRATLAPRFVWLCAVVLCLAALPLAAQQTAPAAAPKNLQVLQPMGLMDVMRDFNVALGVQCNYCHTPGDFASDANPHKQTARTMIALVRQIEPYFMTTAGQYPRGYHEVDCVTCHRGSAIPETKTPAHFLAIREARNPPTDNDPGVNLKALAPGTPVHGAFSIMEIWRDSLNVDCGYCHGGPGGFPADNNPRKETTRRMIDMTRKINANFPGTGVYPDGKLEVTCYTCHHGTAQPSSGSNRGYVGPMPPPPAQ